MVDENAFGYPPIIVAAVGVKLVRVPVKMG